MNDEDPSPEPELDLSSVYVAQYRLHLTQVQTHLSGDDDQSLPSSYIPPTGYWSSAEKAAFFHALCIYSRFRPDLIADCIKTKTVVDVCAYMDLLGEAASGYQCPQAHTLRQNLEGAMEVSDSWVDWEGKQAAALIAIEPTWEDEALESEREEKMSAREALLQGNEMDEEEQARRREEYETWECDNEAQWRKEKALRRLDLHRLKVMDGMLRVTEYGSVGVTVAPHGERLASQPILSRASSPVPAIDDEVIDPALRVLSSIPAAAQPILQPAQASSLVHYLPHLDPSIPQAPQSVPFQTLPSLPSLSPSHLPHSTPVFTAEPERESDLIPSDLSPTSRRRFQKRLYMRRKRAEFRGEEVNVEVTKLKPGRKTQKERTLKPRPKKYKPKAGKNVEDEQADREGEAGRESMAVDAKADSGNSIAGGSNGDAIYPMDVDGNVAGNTNLNATHVELPQLTPDEVPSQEHEQEAQEEETGRPKEYTHPRKPGKTKPYKIRDEFAKLGIDVETLRASGLELFHLSGVGRLMKLYKSGYGAATPKATLTSISPDTIRLLNAIVVDFTTEAVHRAIISREQEFKLKGKIKVWRLTNQIEIMVTNVEHALEMMGVVALSKKKYFENLVDTGEKIKGQSEGEKQGRNDGRGEARVETTVDSEDLEDEGQGDGDDEDDGDEDESSPEDEQTSFPTLLPLHRELHAPLIRLPLNLSSPSSRPARGPSFPLEPSLMPMETDEDEMLDELEEELMLDKRDKIVEGKYERELWAEVCSSMTT